MKPLQYATTFDRLRGEPAWRLLAAHNAPEIIGLLQHLLFDTDRVLPASVLMVRLSTELSLLKQKSGGLSGTAQFYLRDWLNEGWLERRLPESASEEEYELSTAAMDAVRVVNSFYTQRATATESRLQTVMSRLEALAQETDPNDASRLRSLLEERQRLDERIEALQRGDADLLPHERALERVQDILGLARELSEDFRRVRQQLADLNREFRERIIQDEGNRGAVLAALFEGRNVIAETAAGKTFNAFWTLLTDPEQSVHLSAAIDQVSRRDFMRQMPKEDRHFLANLTRTLLDRASSVNNVQAGFTKSLRNYVQSREYQEQRRLTKLLRAAKADALAARNVLRPDRDIGMTLQLSGSDLDSIGRWKLNDPPLTINFSDMVDAAPAMLDMEQLRASINESEIDYRSLFANLQDALVKRSQISIGQMLALYPATQGLGTVVGYLSLGHKHGDRIANKTDTAQWITLGGQKRLAHIPLIYFKSEKRESLRA